MNKPEREKRNLPDDLEVKKKELEEQHRTSGILDSLEIEGVTITEDGENIEPEESNDHGGRKRPPKP